MSLEQQAERCLRAAGYRTQPSIDVASMIYFEDYSLLGFCAVYESVDQLLENWSAYQDTFLQKNAPFLRVAARKAWNCYTVHLTAAGPTDVQVPLILDIEENFASTRKIARANLVTEADVQRALYPLIPIQNLLQMPASHSDLDISQRFHDWPTPALKALLGAGTAEDIVELLMEGE